MTHRSRSGGPPKAHVQRPSYVPGRPKAGAGKSTQPKKGLPQPISSDPSSSSSTSDPRPAGLFPTDQDIFDVIHHALEETLEREDYIELVQKVKGLLYEKKWLDVFEHPEPGYLEAYAGRWVPGRVLCFRDLFWSIREIRQIFSTAEGNGFPSQRSGGSSDGDEDVVEDSEGRQEDGSGNRDESDSEISETLRSARLAETCNGGGRGDEPSPKRIYSLGGGAGSEYLAISSLLVEIFGKGKGKGKGKAEEHHPPIEFVAYDLGSWESILSSFRHSVESNWDVPLSLEYHRTNLLSTPTPFLTSLITHPPQLITILYTLTELFTQSRSATLSLLSSLASHCPVGTLLLVADSASDISEFLIGNAGRTWPIYMILDMFLLSPTGTSSSNGSGSSAGSETGGRDGSKRDWEVVEKGDSKWYRLAPGVGANWKTKIENTRYWYRLYRRI